MLSWAWPEALRGAEAKTVAPSYRVMVPEALDGVTATVRVRLAPKVMELAEAVRVREGVTVVIVKLRVTCGAGA